jgi:hypothetical protein
MLSPARWTTASRPSSRSGSRRPRSGSQATSPAPREAPGRRSARTSAPPAERKAESGAPTNPEAPVTATRSRRGPSETPARARSDRSRSWRNAKVLRIRRSTGPAASLANEGSAYSTVGPSAEGAPDLLVDELRAGDHVAMDGLPPEAERPQGHRQQDPRSGLEASGARVDPDALPRGEQPIERSAPRVPVEGGGGGDREGRSGLEAPRLHGGEGAGRAKKCLEKYMDKLPACAHSPARSRSLPLPFRSRR